MLLAWIDHRGDDAAELRRRVEECQAADRLRAIAVAIARGDAPADIARLLASLPVAAGEER